MLPNAPPPRSTWKEKFLDVLGTGILTGISFGDWLRLVAANRCAIPPRYWLRATAISGYSLLNSVLRLAETAVYSRRIEEAPVLPPLFILGHWRSGTTYLHNILAHDPRFAYPNLFQVLNPHTFLLSERFMARLIGFAIPTTRLGIDNVSIHADLPNEDEFALFAMTLMSPYGAWVFPRHDEQYEKYLTFREVPEPDVMRWKEALRWLVKKLTLRHARPLVLKSPPHTGRVKMLLELFPDAKFVHIHRHPYEVFQSTRRLKLQTWQFFNLQTPDEMTLNDCIIRQYTILHDAFFQDRALIPPEQYHEMSFKDLEADPVNHVRELYERLGLPDFAAAEPQLREYAESQRGYRKNEHPDLAPELRQRLSHAWHREFAEWGYEP